METIYQALTEGIQSLEKEVKNFTKELVKTMGNYAKEEECFRSKRGIPFNIKDAQMLLFMIRLLEDDMILGYNSYKDGLRFPKATKFIKFSELDLTDKVELLTNAKVSFAELKVEKKN